MFRYQSEPQAVDVFVLHEPSDDEPVGLILEAVGVPGLTKPQVLLSAYPGPMVAGQLANWWRWTLVEDSPDMKVGPCLSEDEDDVGYGVRLGLLVTIVGSRTAYVVCGSAEAHLPEHTELESTVCRLASHPFFAPVEG